MCVDLPRCSLAHNPFLATSLACTYFSRSSKTVVSVNSSSFSLSSLTYKGLFSLERRGLRGWGGLSAVFRYIMGSYREDRARLLTEVHSKRSEAMITNSSKENFDSKILTMKKIVQMKSGSALKQMPKDTVGFPSLEDEAWLGKALSTLVWLWCWPCVELKVGPAGPFQFELFSPQEIESSVQTLCGGMMGG